MKRNIFTATMALLSALFTFPLYAQFSELDNYVTRTWTSTDGLPGNSVSDVLQSADGFMYLELMRLWYVLTAMNLKV